ncbi:MAG: GNAT family N-acetyltransferase [Actinobacteria bacterium]|nr:GNAT family N-acetyltransferase [Actinomycetota bacterium]
MTLDYRPLRDTEYDALAALLNVASMVDGRAQHVVGEELREEFESMPINPTIDTLTAWQGNQLVGAVYMMYLRSDVREERCYVFGTVHPDHRGAGIGRRLLEWGLARGTDLLQSSGNDLPKYLRVGESRVNTSAIRLFERFGLESVRYFADLRADLSVPTPARHTAAATPAAATPGALGFRIIPWDLARNEEARLMKNAAFMDHWGSTPTPPEWWAAQTSGFGSRVDWSYFAVTSEDQIIGHLITHRTPNDDEVLGAKYAWIDNIGTLAEHRGRGIATQLITTALAKYRAEGMQFAALGVDSANPTGAYRLYESLGFRLWREFVTYQRVVSAC